MNVPQPLSQPHPPIMVGGGGERKTLRLAAKYADAVSVFGDADTARHKYQVLRNWCEVEGRPYEAIERTTLQTVNLRGQYDGASAEQLLGRLAPTPRQVSSTSSLTYRTCTKSHPWSSWASTSSP